MNRPLCPPIKERHYECCSVDEVFSLKEGAQVKNLPGTEADQRKDAKQCKGLHAIARRF